MAETAPKVAPAAPTKPVEMTAIHEIHHGKVITKPGGKFFIDPANAAWLVENGAASPVDPA